MKDPKFVKTRRSYDPEFKQEVIEMLVSGRKCQGSFGGFCNCREAVRRRGFSIVGEEW